MAKIPEERLESIKNELRISQLLVKEDLGPILRENLRRYMGQYVPEIGTGWDINLNEVYPIVQNNLPATFFRNPRAFLKPKEKTYVATERDPVTREKVKIQKDSSQSAKTQESILNYSLVEMKYKKETRKVLLDALLYPYGVMWHGYKGDFGMTEEKSIFIKKDNVFVQRIGPDDFFYDPTVNIANIQDAGWVARRIRMKLSEIKEDDALDVDKSLLKGFKGFGQVLSPQTGDGADITSTAFRSRALIDFTTDKFKNSDLSRFIDVFEVFVRPTKKEKKEGKKGYILLLTDEQKKPLRVNEWGIKAEGFPTQILEFNDLPDNSFGLSDIETYKTIADQKNAIVNLQLRNAQENSKVWVGISKGNMNEEEVERIRLGENSIVLFDTEVSPRERMFVSSPGGQASSELYIIDQRIQKNLEDKSGVTDLKRGFLQSGEESATSVKIRAAGGGARPAYRQDIMSDFLTNSFVYINQLNRQFMPFKKAVRIIGSLDLDWSENPSKEDLQAEVDVEIDAISMLPENPEEELRRLNDTLMLMVQGLSDPIISQKIAAEGKTIQLTPLIEQILLRQRIRNPDIFRNIKPQESEGFVSVKEIRDARENANAAIQGATIDQVPHPPTPDDDHRAKIEVYGSIQALGEQIGQVNETLAQLIQVQAALMQQVQEKQATPGQKVNLKPPTFETVG